MKNSALDYMHRLLAESLYRGYTGRRPSHEEATVLAAQSVRWFRELLLRLSIQSCIEEIDPIADDFVGALSFESAGAFEGLDEAGASNGSIGSNGRKAFEGASATLEGFDIFDTKHQERSGQPRLTHSHDEALWDALCEGRLILRIDGSEVSASVMPRTPPSYVH